jgi:uncharacterized membrane protein
MQRLDALRERLRLSLWFVPGLFAVAAAVGALLLIALDRQLAEDGLEFFRFGGGAEGARSVLSTVAQSMLTFTGLVFTITMLVLQLAANQLSPRVMRTYLRDRQNQIVLGLFVATFLFTLVVLRDVRSPDGDEGFVPGVSIWVSFVLLVASIGAFIFYIDHMAHAIRASTVITAIGDEARDVLDRLYPAHGADGTVRGPVDLGTFVGDVPADRAGTLIGVDGDRLLAELEATRLSARLAPMVGDFVTRGSALFELFRQSEESDGVSEVRDPALIDALRASVTLGEERTVQQDLAFSIRQLIDIGARALSPGTNDPTTAVQAIDQVHDLMRGLIARPFAPSVRLDRSGRARLELRRPGWDDYVALAFDELRLYGSGHLQVTRRLAFALRDLISIAPADRRSSLLDQLARLEDGVTREFADPGDRARATEGSARGQGPAAGGTTIRG